MEIQRIYCPRDGHAPGITPSFLFRWRRNLAEVIGAALFLRATDKRARSGSGAG